MARLPRIIVPEFPHHVTQRGNRRQRVFMEDDDYALYKDWLARSCRSNSVKVWSYCLMPNHVHLILVPSDDTGLSRAVGETHRRYSGYINSRLRVTGHLFQGRFGCVAMDESRLMCCFSLCCFESRQGETCYYSSGLDVVQHAGALQR